MTISKKQQTVIENIATAIWAGLIIWGLYTGVIQETWNDIREAAAPSQYYEYEPTRL
jgi:hypothetical protein